MIFKSLLLLAFASQTLADELPELYKDRYKIKDPHLTLVNNHGDGFEPLYGTRNFTVVLHGVLYRGGGNNSRHKVSPRNNVNPLQDSALENLCKEGFSSAIYAYKTNFETAKTGFKCDSFRQLDNQFDYLSITAHSGNGAFEVLDRVYRVATSQQQVGPIYYHCWNGWHASGYLAAVALIQFCDISNEEALTYWKKTISGDPTKYQTVMNQIKAFKPFSALRIEEKLKKDICPDFDKIN